MGRPRARPPWRHPRPASREMATTQQALDRPPCPYMYHPAHTWPGCITHERPMSSRPTQFKVVLLGEGRVGKTSLVLRFCKGTFTDGQPPTIQASCLDKVLRIGDKSLHLVIWDTAGQERFKSLIPSYIKDSAVAIVCYDVTSRDSFLSIEKWIEDARALRDDDVLLILAGNKSDMEA